MFRVPELCELHGIIRAAIGEDAASESPWRYSAGTQATRWQSKRPEILGVCPEGSRSVLALPRRLGEPSSPVLHWKKACLSTCRRNSIFKEYVQLWNHSNWQRELRILSGHCQNSPGSSGCSDQTKSFAAPWVRFLAIFAACWLEHPMTASAMRSEHWRICWC